MAAPIGIAHTHVHSLRLLGGSEALAAKVRTHGGGTGFGFSLSLEAEAARDMAAWDAFARAHECPLYLLLGGAYRAATPVRRDAEAALDPDLDALREGILQNRFDLLRVDPWALGTLERFQSAAALAQAFDLDLALLAPHAHPWELAWCATLAATLPGADTRIIVRGEPPCAQVAPPRIAGAGIDWAQEPAFASLTW